MILFLSHAHRNFVSIKKNKKKEWMRNLNLENFSSLLHTDWNPEKGDFVKENSLQDSAQFNSRIRKHNIIIASLISAIVIVFVGAIVLLSL